MWPKAGFENFSTPIILQYSCVLSVGVNTQVNPGMVIGLFSQWWVRTRYPRWFTKYKYVIFALPVYGRALMRRANVVTSWPRRWMVAPRSSRSS